MSDWRDVRHALVEVVVNSDNKNVLEQLGKDQQTAGITRAVNNWLKQKGFPVTAQKGSTPVMSKTI